MLRRPFPAVSRLGAVVFGLAVTLAIVPTLVPLLPGGEDLSEGDTAPRTLVAVHAAQYESSALTETARESAAEQVAPIYLQPNSAVRVAQSDILAELIDKVREIRGRTNLTAAQQIDEIAQVSAAESLSSDGRTTLIVLDQTGYESISQQAQTGLAAILGEGVREGEELSAVRNYLAEPGASPTSSIELRALSGLLTAFVVPNVFVDEAATAADQQAARDAVVPVIASFVPSQIVVNERDTIQAADIEALQATGVLDTGFHYADAAAGGLAAAVYGFALAFAAWSVQPFGRPVGRRLLLVGIAVVAVSFTTRFMLPVVFPDTEARFLAYAIPVATAAMLAASVGNFAFASVVAFATGLLAAFIGATVTELPGTAYGGTVEAVRLATAYSAAGVAGAACMAGAERMRRSAFAAVAVAAVTAVVLLMFWLLSIPRTTEELGWILLAATVSGLASSVLATGLFVLLSLVLGIPTRMQLFELAQAEHPLLKRLQEEAPGTYHHSLLVGTLSERAAGNIGGDALLARVGAYYHDIGKLSQPEYFIENMVDPSKTPHQQLSSEDSAEIIRSHVTDGLELARKARLPNAVSDFIPQHHGTRLVTYFYRQASANGGEVDPADYRYPGPRPVGREAAIVMLADSCEAVIRAATDHSPTNIDDLVDNVLGERLAEGQLDDCEITLRELQVVGATFKATLRAVYHPRIEYPRRSPEELEAVASGGHD